MTDIPAAIAELECQPIKDFRVRGGQSLKSKVIGSPDQSRSKQKLPELIDDHPRRQRVLIRNQPTGEIQPRGFGTQCDRQHGGR